MAHRNLYSILLRISLVACGVLVAVPRPGAAQSLTAGAHVGVVQSRQSFDRGADSESRDGYLIGASVSVDTPIPWLNALVEASAVQRGAVFRDADSGFDSEVQADYLTITLAPVVGIDLGPVTLFGYAGPSTEFNLRVRSSADLSAGYRDAKAQVFAVTAGAGVEIGVAPGWSLSAAVRHARQVSAAFEIDFDDIRHRSTELVIGIGRRLVR